MPAPAPLPLGVLVSGRGSNLRALLAAAADESLPARVAAVACNHADAPAVAVARDAGVPLLVAPRADFPSRLAQQQGIAAFLDAAGVGLVVLAGWDRIFEPEFCRHYTGRLVNLHPSLLPAFPGTMHAIAEALAYGVKVTGVTVHFVTTDLDAGPIILQEAVPIRDDDTLEALTARVQAVEHRLLPRAIALYAADRLEIAGRHVRIRPANPDET